MDFITTWQELIPEQMCSICIETGDSRLSENIFSLTSHKSSAHSIKHAQVWASAFVLVYN